MNGGSRPGTVSKILWHFTGGPEWDRVLNQYSGTPKNPLIAYNNLVSIVESKELRVGNFREEIRVHGEIVRTQKVCCVADIPIAHLHFHGLKYGKMAIGFKRKTLIRKRFNPVFYVKEDKPAMLRFHDALSSLQDLDLGPQEFMTLMLGQNNSEIDSRFRDDLLVGLNEIKDRVKKASDHLLLMQSFIKTLKDEDDFDSIFCEREWRNNVSLDFTYNDIAMIVLPHRGQDGNDYFSRFLEKASDLGIPRKVPIVSWEDLIEH
jgi:hypothetical protein